MAKISNPIVYDRAITIRTREEIYNFLGDPKSYLRKSGALEGLPAFNGFVDVDGNEIDPKALRQRWEPLVPGSMVSLGHLGVPYADPWFCMWVVLD